jgi:hypothetical protein
MTQSEFLETAKKFYQEAEKILNSKGKEYAADEDRLANFKDVGKELGVSPELICYVYMRKHLRSIESYLRTGKKSVEMSSRLQDISNYILFFYALLQDRDLKAMQEPSPGKPFNGITRMSPKEFPAHFQTQVVFTKSEHDEKLLLNEIALTESDIKVADSSSNFKNKRELEAHLNVLYSKLANLRGIDRAKETGYGGTTDK